MEFDENKKARIYAMGHSVVKLPILGLVAKCYEFLLANLLPETPPVTMSDFNYVFDRIVLGPTGIQLLLYDAEIDAFCFCDVGKVDVKRIVQIEQPPNPDRNPWNSPSFDIDSRLHIGVRYGGSGQDLYNQSELIRKYIVAGWSNLKAIYGARPVGHISPYDLCALGNLTELGNRLTWFIRYIINYRSVYQDKVQISGELITDQEDIMSASLFYSLTMQYFATIIKLPMDPELQKTYLVRSWVKFHETIIEEGTLGPLKEMYEEDGDILDTETLRIIPMTRNPEIGFVLLTSGILF